MDKVEGCYITPECLTKAENTKRVLDCKKVYEIMERENTVASNFRVFSERVKEDEELAWGWHCNIAVCAQDEGVSHQTAQKIASRFMSIAFGVDTEKLYKEHFPQYK